MKFHGALRWTLVLNIADYYNSFYTGCDSVEQ